jgi:hypothetical protein
MQTLSFPPPPDVPAAAGTAAVAPQPHTPAAPASDPEDVYEHLVERLRHDLRAERERFGALIPELPE